MWGVIDRVSSPKFSVLQIIVLNAWYKAVLVTELEGWQSTTSTFLIGLAAYLVATYLKPVLSVFGIERQKKEEV